MIVIELSCRNTLRKGAAELQEYNPARALLQSGCPEEQPD